MKQFALTLCMVLLSVMFCRAQIKPLKFDKNGEFKIVQFTDVHFQYGNPASDIALKRINEVLDAEHPDLVVFTGDVVYAKPAETAMRTVLACASSRKIPFVVTFGNHDNEQERRVPNYMMSFALFLIIFSRKEVRPIPPTTCLHCRLPTVIVMQLCCIVWIRTPTPGCRM